MLPPNSSNISQYDTFAKSCNLLSCTVFSVVLRQSTSRSWEAFRSIAEDPLLFRKDCKLGKIISIQFIGKLLVTVVLKKYIEHTLSSLGDAILQEFITPSNRLYPMANSSKFVIDANLKNIFVYYRTFQTFSQE